jgi:group II intron reverse transcriptase/maturase
MYENLMEAAVTDENCAQALQAVKRNQGAAGMDRMTTAELEPHLQANWWILKDKLLKGTYVPSPVRRVEIPKPSGGTRTLGIPTVQDRFIQQLLLQVLTPVFDPHFSEHSYGFRPGRSAQDAVRAAQQYAQGGKDWVVDIDITKFFDHVHHDILMGRIANVIRDKRVLHLIGKYLRRGAMVEGVVTASVEGTPQGGPLSPLLANLYLDALDLELDRRGHCFCRYADDCAPRAQRGRGGPNVCNCLIDEGGPLGTGWQEQVPNHLRRLWSKAMVVSTEGKGLERTRSGDWQGEDRKGTTDYVSKA